MRMLNPARLGHDAAGSTCISPPRLDARSLREKTSLVFAIDEGLLVRCLLNPDSNYSNFVNFTS